MSSAPLLADITVDGKPIKAVAVPSKQTLLYVFDRVTGEPIWPIDEKPVPQGDVPGEWYSPTQPLPTKPVAVWTSWSEHRTTSSTSRRSCAPQALKKLERYKWGGPYPYSGTLYNPPIVGNVNGLLGAINIGNANGGTNWPGGGFDPETRIVYAHAGMAYVTSESVAPPPRGFLGSSVPGRRRRRGRSACARPPAPAPTPTCRGREPVRRGRRRRRRQPRDVARQVRGPRTA